MGLTTLVAAVVAIPIAVVLMLITLRAPMAWGLPIFAVLLPFGQLFAVGSSRFGSWSSLFAVVLTVGLLLQVVSAHRQARSMSATVPLWLLFLAAAGATSLWSIDPKASQVGFVSLSSLVLIFILVAASRVDRTVLERIQKGLLVGGVLVVFYGFVQLLFLGGFPNNAATAAAGTDGRFGNNLLGPNNQAIALLIPLMIALSRMVTTTRRSHRFGYASVSALLLAGILLTGSRGGLLSAAVALVVLTAGNGAGRRRLAAYGAVALVLAALVWIYHPGGVADRSVKDTSSSGRTSIWRVGLSACPEYCGRGAGWETFPDVYAQKQASVPGASVLVGQGGSYQAHDVWLLVAVELGLPGLICFAAALLVTLVEALRLPAALRGPPLAGLVGTLVGAIFLSNLEYKFFWMALIMVALARNVAIAERDAEGGPPATLGEAPLPEPAPAARN